MVSVLADKWTVSISPVCPLAGWRGEGRGGAACAQALTQKADERTRTYRAEMRANKCLRMFVCAHAWTRTHTVVS